jgi:hypothetical protein
VFGLHAVCGRLEPLQSTPQTPMRFPPIDARHYHDGIWMAERLQCSQRRFDIYAT